MFAVYVPDHNTLTRMESPAALPQGAVWIDLLDAQDAEESLVEQALQIDVPTRAEMHKIDISNRLYRENDALFMTATLLSSTHTEAPRAEPVTFILSHHALITVRYSDPRSFQTFAGKVQKPFESYASGEAVLTGLLEAVVDRLADVLEGLANDVNALSDTIFAPHDVKTSGPGGPFKDLLVQIARKGDLNTKARESLVSLERLLAFLANSLDPSRTVSRDLKGRIRTLTYDVHALSDHVSFLSNKINFLLDATLGMINIEQNAIIKIFSVAAVIFLPPTLVASVYGMNFDVMPELNWMLGYPFALGLMVVSAIVPYLYFKKRRWL